MFAVPVRMSVLYYSYCAAWTKRMANSDVIANGPMLPRWHVALIVTLSATRSTQTMPRAHQVITVAITAMRECSSEDTSFLCYLTATCVVHVNTSMRYWSCCVVQTAVVGCSTWMIWGPVARLLLGPGIRECRSCVDFFVVVQLDLGAD